MTWFTIVLPSLMLNYLGQGALVLDNRFDPASHDPYFESLARFVTEGLARCGYTLCTGDVMATNPRWRQPLRVWQGYFKDWIEKPSAEGLLNSSIFFDLDGVHGRTEWADSLRRSVAQQARQHPRFLASMARNALLRTPPLGFFKGFVLEADGRHSAGINLKRRGTAPLTDLIRVHALAVGSEALNSFDRLDDVIQAGVLSPGRGLRMCAMRKPTSVGVKNSPALCPEPSANLRNSVGVSGPLARPKMKGASISSNEWVAAPSTSVSMRIHTTS